MKIRSFPVGLMILVLLSASLTGCGDLPASPTSTPFATQTATLVIPTQTPTATPPESPLPPEMTEKYLGKFEKTEQGIKQINGVDTNVIYGIKEDGTKQVIAMEMEIDGKMRMTRVGEYTDEAGFSYYTVILPEYSSEGRFSVTDRTSQILLGEPEGAKDVNIWNSLAKQLGFATAAEARDFVMIKNGGKLQFKVAYGQRQKATDKAAMTDLPYPANFNLPIEIRTIITQADYQSLPQNIKDVMIQTNFDRNNDSGVIFGRLLYTKKDGGIIVYTVCTAAEVHNRLDPSNQSTESIQYMNEDFRKQISYEILRAVQLFGNGYTNNATYDRQSRQLLEIDGLTFKDPSQ